MVGDEDVMMACSTLWAVQESAVMTDILLLFGLVRDDVICDLKVSLVLLLVD